MMTESGKPISVLIMDDNPTFLRLALLILSQHPEVKIVGTILGGKDGLEIADRLKPDVALIDLVMPDVSGIEVISHLRETVPETGIVALTLFYEEGYREAALQAGADDFVRKDHISTELLPAIQRAHGKRSKTEQNS